MAHLELEGIVQRYGSHTVVNGVGFCVQTGKIACLLGPSGCGKTTLLRCIAGFEEITSGEIRIETTLVSRAGFRVPPERRRIGMVFQDYALFPHLTVGENIGFGLAKITPDERATRVDELLATVGLSGQGRKYPHELSGGQQQRVALARALAPRPQLILLDEPFSNLDVDLRERLSLEVRDILKSQGITAVLVTHDQHEAFAMADHIAVMADHRIQQWGTPLDTYHEPVNRLVADFLGEGAWISARILEGQRIACELGSFTLPHAAQDKTGSSNELLIRADDILHDDDSPTRARVVAKTFRGANFLYTLALPSGQTVYSLVPSHHDHPLGSDIGIRLELNHLVRFEVEVSGTTIHP